MVTSDLLVNFHLPFLFIAILMGFQITGYFFNLYVKGKRQKLDLNRIHLAYGVIYLFLFSTIFVRTIYSYYIGNAILKEFVFRSSHVILAIGAIIFLYILASKVFREIINTIITKLIAIIALIIIILFSLMQSQLYQLIVIIFAVSIAGAYLFVFHYRLIGRTAGDIKKRLIIIVIGNIIMVVGIFSQADEIISIFSENTQILLMIFSAPILIAGEFIVFLGLFKFPAFLEFNWYEHVISFTVVDRQNLVPLYRYDFRPIKDLSENIEQNQILEKNKAKTLSMGLVGIDKIFSFIIQSGESKVEKIMHGDLIILLKQGVKPFDFMTYALIVNKEMISLTYFLKQLQTKFEIYYKNILLNLDFIKGKESSIFSSFDDVIKNTVMLKNQKVLV